MKYIQTISDKLASFPIETSLFLSYTNCQWVGEMEKGA